MSVFPLTFSSLARGARNLPALNFRESRVREILRSA